MIVFKQKEFWVGPAIAAGVGVLGTAVSGAQMYQANEQEKAAKERDAEMQEKVQKQNELLDKIARRAKADPEVARKVMAQRNYSGHLRVKRFAALPNLSTLKNLFTAQNVKGLGKDIWTLTKANKGRLIKDTAMGVTMGAGAYGVNKAIEIDKNRLEKQGQAEAQQELQRSYSAASIAKTVGGILKKDKGNLALWGGGMAALPAVGYLAERDQIKQQAKQTALQGGSVLQKEYSVGQYTRAAANFFKGIPGMFKGGGAKVSNFFKAPVKNTLSGASNLMGMGGEAGVESFANRFANSKNSELSQAIGNFAKNHKKTALAGSVIAGGGLMNATWGGGEKAVRKTAEALDPNAFAYEKSKEEMIQ